MPDSCEPHLPAHALIQRLSRRPCFLLSTSRGVGGEAPSLSLSLSFLPFLCQPSVHYDCISCVATSPRAGSGLVDQRVQLVIALLGEVQSCNSGLAPHWLADLFVLDKSQVSAISCEKLSPDKLPITGGCWD